MLEFLNGDRWRGLVPIPIRMILGVGFMVHGWAKWNRGPAAFAELLKQAHVPLPLANAWLVTLLEIFGGLAPLIGAFVAIVSIPLILSMLGAMFTVNIKYGFSAVNTIGLTPEGPQLGPPGYEINLLYIRFGGADAWRCGSFVDRCPYEVAAGIGISLFRLAIDRLRLRLASRMEGKFRTLLATRSALTGSNRPVPRAESFPRDYCTQN